LSSDDFAHTLEKCLATCWSSQFDRVLRLLDKFALKLPFGTVVLPILQLFNTSTSETKLQRIVSVYQILVAEARTGRRDGDPWPVIIIDEANILLRWEDKKALRQLLDVFVRLTKQEQLAHVILATSDGDFLRFLDEEGIDESCRDVLVVGNLGAAESREFFFSRVLTRFTPALSCSDADWAHVFEACGGNPGALRRCAAAAGAQSRWTMGAHPMECKVYHALLTSAARPATRSAGRHAHGCSRR